MDLRDWECRPIAGRAAGGPLLFSRDEGTLYCLSGQGQAFWTRRLEGDPATLVTAGGRLFAAGEKTLYVITTDGQVQSTPAPAGQLFNRRVVAVGDRVLGAMWTGPLFVIDGAGKSEPAGPS